MKQERSELNGCGKALVPIFKAVEWLRSRNSGPAGPETILEPLTDVTPVPVLNAIAQAPNSSRDERRALQSKRHQEAEARRKADREAKQRKDVGAGDDTSIYSVAAVSTHQEAAKDRTAPKENCRICRLPS